MCNKSNVGFQHIIVLYIRRYWYFKSHFFIKHRYD